MNVQVCIGSSCYLRGAHDIVRLLRERLEERGLSDKVELSGCFCLGKCSPDGVSVKVDDEIVCGVSSENFEGFFEDYIVKRA
jgi:NADH:ubiquinone oxidoreductase subunit E